MDYESLMSLLASYTKEEIEAIFAFLKAFKELSTKNTTTKVSHPNKKTKEMWKLYEKCLADTTPEHETPEQYELRKRRIKQCIDENETY